MDTIIINNTFLKSFINNGLIILRFKPKNNVGFFKGLPLKNDVNVSSVAYYIDCRSYPLKLTIIATIIFLKKAL